MISNYANRHSIAPHQSPTFSPPLPPHQDAHTGRGCRLHPHPGSTGLPQEDLHSPGPSDPQRLISKRKTSRRQATTLTLPRNRARIHLNRTTQPMRHAMTTKAQKPAPLPDPPEGKPLDMTNYNQTNITGNSYLPQGLPRPPRNHPRPPANTTWPEPAPQT